MPARGRKGIIGRSRNRFLFGAIGHQVLSEIPPQALQAFRSYATDRAGNIRRNQHADETEAYKRRALQSTLRKIGIALCDQLIKPFDVMPVLRTDAASKPVAKRRKLT